MSERLDIELVIRDLARSRTQAGALIAAGRVTVNSKPVTKASQKIEPEDSVVVSEGIDFVSRAGHKLAHALEVFQISPAGVCLDAGASTGGFTQVLLENGAEKVIAVDVGHNQLVDELKSDPRVTSLEGQNLRNFTLEQLLEHTSGEPVNLVVVDLSFISLTLVCEKLAELAAGAPQIWLIKPQFEVGKHSLSATGVVSSRTERRRAIEQVLDGARAANLHCQQITESPIKGTNGNTEYLALFGSQRIEYSKETEIIEALFAKAD